MSTSDNRPVVVVTRDARADDRFVRALESVGARPLALPTVEIVPPVDSAPFDDALSVLASFDWIVFTSVNAVDAVCDHPRWHEKRRTTSSIPRIAAVGAATASRLADHGVFSDLVPARSGGGRELVASLSSRVSLHGARVLWPRSDVAMRDVADGLEAAGAIVLDPVAYRTKSVLPPGLPRFVDDLAAGRIAAVAFLSPSSVRGLADALPDGTLGVLAGRTLIASLGATTTGAIQAAGGRVDIEASDRTVTSLAVTIMKRLTNRRGDAA